MAEGRITLSARHVEAVRMLPVSQRGQLYNAIIEYALTGVAPKLTGAAAGMFIFIGADIDAAKKRAKQADNVDTNVCTNVCTNVDTNVCTNVDTPENGAIYIYNNNLKDKSLKALKDKNIAPFSPADEKTTSAPPTGKARPEKPPKRKHGEYGWVTLTDKQHHALINEHGADKIARYIAYVDEYVQTTGNKNKYRDFYLVMCKALREGWADKPETDAERKRRILAEPFEWGTPA